MREDFMAALNDMIDGFAAEPGISDEEIVATLLAKVSETSATIRRLQGEGVEGVHASTNRAQ